MKIYKVIGLMSGTSLDGLDLAYCHIWKTPIGWDFEIKRSKSIAYDKTMESQLKNAIYLPATELLELHNTYGSWLGKQAKAFIDKYHLEVDFIASHGHTTHHQPQKGFTFQIGSGQHLAHESGKKVICDFRSNDVALGGQGAPLVPIGDQLFFGQYDYCLNLGGISNISFQKNGQRLAYDIGLANMILNHITQKINLNYDKNGTMASKGQINSYMLQELNKLEFYQLPFPKSIGFEWFVEKVLPIVDNTQDSIENLLHTSIHHITEQINVQIKLHNIKTNSRLFVTGGGALNTFLMDTLQDKLGANVKIIIPTDTLIEFKEALIFALMGVLRDVEETNCLSSVTGAKKDCSGGVIYLPS
ncbi:anhydro-N-acetylmuramic acid kinase [Arenibacter sp. 6A1]|uniref:anhydro-N-acetylmuramic acid kinase n=1 Tax=Arenibacter sp. 6A1 TaxID=2720391 RepID=UPI00144596BE|nr:anhydro-N-acetylmuramic acid kinase [Arenibacter sp. 6A1]NKI27736.1 anhydro-N-acetylmuramic acid kinase [Arenibacter sp. 6A1]